jgi:gag-polypeptide of LTR copia-type
MATETKPTSAIEKMRWVNRKDEATGLLLELISTDLWFHVAACKTPNEIWTTLEGLFGKQDEMRGHMLEVELNTLDPKSFDNIQDFFTKFKSLILSLGECGIDKSTQEKQLILTILAKLGPEYTVYVSNFHSGRCLFGTNWKMPTLAQFIESLTQEQTKLIHMGLMKDPKAHALTM